MEMRWKDVSIKVIIETGRDKGRGSRSVIMVDQ